MVYPKISTPLSALILPGQDAGDYDQLRRAVRGVFAIIHTAFNLAEEKSTTGYKGDPENFAMGRFTLKAAVEVDARHCIMARLDSDPRDRHTVVYGVSNRVNPPYPTDNPFGWESQSWFGNVPGVIPKSPA